MTTFNTDYNNTELLDQELSFDQLQEVNGGSYIPEPLISVIRILAQPMIESAAQDKMARVGAIAVYTGKLIAQN